MLFHSYLKESFVLHSLDDVPILTVGWFTFLLLSFSHFRRLTSHSLHLIHHFHDVGLMDQD